MRVLAKLTSAALAAAAVLLPAASAQTVTTPSSGLNFTTRVATSSKRVILRRVTHYDVTARTLSNDEGQAEFFVFDEDRARLWVVNSALEVVDIYSLGADGSVTFLRNLTESGVPNSVAYNPRDGVVAIAVTGSPQTTGGEIAFYDAETFATVATVPSGNPLPDHVSFAPGYGCLYSANEGEPIENEEDVFGGITQVCASDFADQATYVVTSSSLADLVLAGVPAGAHNPSGEPANFTRDLEPEYITYSTPDDTTGAYEVYVICQEANTILVYASNVNTNAAISATPLRVMPLGFKDHGLAGNGLDIAEDDVIDIRTYRGVKGIFQPDTIKAVTVGGATYIITANEGDVGVQEELDSVVNVADMTFQTGVMDDPLPAAVAALDERVVQGPAPYDGVYMNGARSFSVFDASSGALVFDSGDQLERVIERFAPEFFGATDARISRRQLRRGLIRERRSEDKGPEPESLATGSFEGTPLLFVGMERPGLIGIWDVTDVTAPVFHSINGVIDDCVTQDRALMADPEAMQFITAEHSPTGKPLLVASGSVSSSITVFEVSEGVVSTDADLNVCARAANGDPATAAPTTAAPTDAPTGAPTGAPTSFAPQTFSARALLPVLAAALAAAFAA